MTDQIRPDTVKVEDTATKRQARLLVASAAVLTAMSATALAPALPKLASGLGQPGASELVKVAMTVPAVATAAAAPLASHLIRVVGVRTTLIAGVIMFALSGSYGLVATSVEAMILSRIILGMALAAISTATLTFIAHSSEEQGRDALLGLHASSSCFAGMIFLISAGFLADIHWRLVFAPFAAAILALVFLRASFPQPRRPPERALHKLAWGPSPFLPCAALFLGSLLFYVMPVDLAFELARRGWPQPIRAGAALAFATLAGGGAAAAYARVRRRWNAKLILGAAFLLVGAGQACIAVGDYVAVVVGALLAGGGVGLLIPCANSLILAAVSPSRAAAAAGWGTACIFLAQFLAVFLAKASAALDTGSFHLVAALAIGIGAAILAHTIGIRPSD